METLTGNIRYLDYLKTLTVYIYYYKLRNAHKFLRLKQIFRSPWTNSYDPPLEDGAMPSERLRKLEVEANAAFDQVCNFGFKNFLVIIKYKFPV